MEKKRKLTDTDTTNGNHPQDLLMNWTLMMITPPIDLRISDGVAAGRWTQHARQTIALKAIVTDTAHISSRVFQNPSDISKTDKYRKIPRMASLP